MLDFVHIHEEGKINWRIFATYPIPRKTIVAKRSRRIQHLKEEEVHIRSSHNNFFNFLRNVWVMLIFHTKNWIKWVKLKLTFNNSEEMMNKSKMIIQRRMNRKSENWGSNIISDNTEPFIDVRVSNFAWLVILFLFSFKFCFILFFFFKYGCCVGFD